ncbi:transcription factor E2F5-like [Brachyistius frenatus]|uniref:transcription factor E2F5-like n=1 Tax=Brachyistius frenatus TaxID=100188 RepID=UPI0037E88E16
MDPEDSPQSEDEQTAMLHQIPKYQRSMRSLHVITRGFVSLLQEAENGVVDLREAVRILAVGQKRRIYDITNVMEGIGLIMKISKSMVKWRGPISGENTQELVSRVTELKGELEDLEHQEFVLEQQKLWVEQSIRNTTEDCNHLTYVNYDDLCNRYTGHTLLAVRAPHGTELDVPIPKAVQNSPAKYQIYLKSTKGPIDVILLNKHSASSVPVVLPVPPPEEMLQRAKSAMSSSDEKQSSNGPSQASANTKHNTKSKWAAMKDTQPLHASSFIKPQPNRTDESELPDLSEEQQDQKDLPKEKLNADLITKLITSEVFSPLLRLSPPPSQHEYIYTLDESEGISDLFDIPVLNV